MTGDYLWHMEDVLDLYEQPYNALRPVLCFDERPCQLVGEVLAPIPMKPGRVKRPDYAYERKGPCCILLACEPLRGWRFVQIRAQRTARDYAACMQELVNTYYPGVERIHLVQDNLHTQTPGAFYHALAPHAAFEWAQKFTLHSTPLKGSWLNMAEIEFSVLARQCLDRRIGDMETLAQEVVGWSAHRNQARQTTRWHFTKNDARRKLQKRYPLLQN